MATALVDELGVRLKYVINTHCHADHVTGGGLIKARRPEVKSVIAAASGERRRQDAHGDRVEFGSLFLETRATPGHTEGCLSYVFDDKVFTGDALLIRGCGRTDFQGGSSDTLYGSVRTRSSRSRTSRGVSRARLQGTPRSSTVGEEKRHNPRLGKGKDEFVEIMANLELAYPKKIDVALPRNMVCGIQDDVVA